MPSRLDFRDAKPGARRWPDLFQHALWPRVAPSSSLVGTTSRTIIVRSRSRRIMKLWRPPPRSAGAARWTARRPPGLPSTKPSSSALV